jgi:hypothetical protein
MLVAAGNEHRREKQDKASTDRCYRHSQERRWQARRKPCHPRRGTCRDYGGGFGHAGESCEEEEEEEGLFVFNDSKGLGSVTLKIA